MARANDETRSMSHILSSPNATRAWSSRIPAGVLTAARFVLHFAEMWIAMLVGMMLFMAIPGVMGLSSVLHQLFNRPSESNCAP